MILDAHNCSWLLKYPREVLAGGSMYAVHLPAEIPAAGTPGGPPLLAAQRRFLNMPGDIRARFLTLVQRPEEFTAFAAEIEQQAARAFGRRRSRTN
jgi:hypothetical protein